MAALFEGATPGTLAGPPGNPRDNVVQLKRPFDSAAISAGLAYVSSRVRGHRPFGIVTGNRAGLELLLNRVTADCVAHEDLHAVRICSPTGSVQGFLAVCLAELGFELFDATTEDLHNLMVVFLRHESARGRRTVVIVDGADDYGPRVFEFMHQLAAIRAGRTPAITFILAGTPDLHRILDSPGMAAVRPLTQRRFDLDQAGAAESSVAISASPVRQPVQRSLVVMLDGAIVHRRQLETGRLLIGRSADADLRLDSRFVSRKHAELVITSGEVVIVDLNSTNTTLVNGNAAVRKRLTHGDMLAIGDFRLRYEGRPALRSVAVGPT